MRGGPAGPSPMRFPAAPALLLLLAGAGCSTQTVRLYELRDAETGSRDREAFLRLEEGVRLANDFLAGSELTDGYPARDSRFEIGMTDLRLVLPDQGIYPLRIRTAGWGDPRTLFGDSLHGNDDGFVAAHDGSVGEDDAADNVFFRLAPEEMGAALLRQGLVMREMRARGSVNYWLNYSLCGLDPTVGWGSSAFVDRAANAVEEAYWEWLAAR